MSDDKMRRIGPNDLLMLKHILPQDLHERPGQVSRNTTSDSSQSQKRDMPDLLDKTVFSQDTSVRVLPSTCPLGICDGTGWYLYPVKFGHPDFGVRKACECRLKDVDGRRRARTVQVLAALDQDMGPDLASATLDNYDLSRAADDQSLITMRFALEICRHYVEQPRGWIYLYGPNGVGKSHLACGTARALANRHHLLVVYTSETVLFPYLRDGYDRRRMLSEEGYISADERMEALQRADVLLFDEIGSERRGKSNDPGGNWADTQIFNLLSERHAKERLTIITSNLLTDDLEPRVRSRIHGRSNVEFSGRNQNLFIRNKDQRRGSNDE